ncbi:MAG: septum formation protein Maf [Clostridia bacterium]|nr:septum formation protein Maf [Clostridia bacterium]
MDWILASASPRRKELLKELIEEFEVIPSLADERVEEGLTPRELVQRLACQKATEVAARPCANGKCVLGSDTVVALDGNILGKPKTPAEAKEMLAALSGRVHEVYTGVCIDYPTAQGRKQQIDAACTSVYFLPLTEETIDAYVATGSPMDKAGAYGIQDGGLVEKIEGSFSNVVGLPVELCAEMIAKVKEMIG